MCSRIASNASRCPGSTVRRKGADIVGLYLNSPDRALVLCLDGKSQIQALDRTASGIFRAALLQILLLLTGTVNQRVVFRETSEEPGGVAKLSDLVGSMREMSRKRSPWRAGAGRNTFCEWSRVQARAPGVLRRVSQLKIRTFCILSSTIPSDSMAWIGR
jgi:hypothetical protein